MSRRPMVACILFAYACGLAERITTRRWSCAVVRTLLKPVVGLVFLLFIKSDDRLEGIQKGKP